MCVWGGGLVEHCPSHSHQPPSRPAAQLQPSGHTLRHSGGVSSGPAKTGNAKDKGRGHDDEKEGEEEGTSRGREGE